MTLNDLAAVQNDRREFPAAKQHYEDALGIFRKVYPANHPYISLTMSNLGQTQGELGEYAEAMKNLEEAIRIQRASVPKQDELIAGSLENLGRVQLDLQRWEFARESLEESLKLRRQTLPKEHAEIAYSLNTLACVHVKRHDHAAAKAMFQEAIDILHKSAATEQIDLAAALLNLGALHSELGESDAATKNLKEALAYRDSLPADHPLIAAALDDLGAVHYGLRDYRAAKASFNDALFIYRKTEPDNLSGISKCLFNLGRLELVSGVDLSNAVRHLGEAIEKSQDQLLRLSLAQTEHEQFFAAFIAEGVPSPADRRHDRHEIRSCLDLRSRRPRQGVGDGPPAMGSTGSKRRQPGSAPHDRKPARGDSTSRRPVVGRAALTNVARPAGREGVGSGPPRRACRAGTAAHERSATFRNVQSWARVGTKEIRNVAACRRGPDRPRRICPCIGCGQRGGAVVRLAHPAFVCPAEPRRSGACSAGADHHAGSSHRTLAWKLRRRQSACGTRA